MPEYQELQRNKSSLPTFTLTSSTTNPNNNKNNPDVASSVPEKKAEVNLPAGGHGECEGASGKQSLRRRISQFRSFNSYSMHILEVAQSSRFSQKILFPRSRISASSWGGGSPVALDRLDGDARAVTGVTGVKTRKTSADVFKSAIQRKVSTFSALHAWKRNCTGNDNVAKESATTEPELKANNPSSKEENGRAKPPKITLSVHKMTPIPSVELDDYTPKQTNGEKSEELADTSLQKNLSWPDMANANQGRGILKKNSVVEWPAETVEENPVEGESGAEVTNNPSAVTAAAGVGEVEPKKEILLGRTVKFDMPSFDSQTSDEIPEIIVEVVTESSSNVLVSEELKYIEPEDPSKGDACDESFEKDKSDTVKEVIRLVMEIEEDIKRTSEEEEEEEDKEVKQLRQQRKRLRRELTVILRAILRNDYALMKQGINLQVDSLGGDEDEEEGEEVKEVEDVEEEEETGVSEKEEEEEGVRHTLVLPLSQILQCTTCWPAAEKEISEDSKVPKRRHSCPSLLTTCCPSWTEEKEEAAFAQTFLCRYREDEDFEDEGLGLGIASQLPLLPATAILGSDWQEREQIGPLPTDLGNLKLCSDSMENVAWDIEGMARALCDARETHMV